MNKKTTFSKTPRPMTPEAIEKAALADRDAQPLTPHDLNVCLILARQSAAVQGVQPDPKPFIEISLPVQTVLAEVV